MKIYKFKDLTEEDKHPHFLQIVLRNSIWCASPDSLNDEHEFKFMLDYKPSPRTAQLLTEVVSQYRTTNFFPPHVSAPMVLRNGKLEEILAPIINNMVQECRNSIGIASFSVKKNDNRLWEEYGGKGNGVLIEINIPDHLVGQMYHFVHYVPQKVFHVDSFLESGLFSNRVVETYRNSLLTKIKRKWAHEEEIRFLSKRPNVNVVFDGYISNVTFGARVPSLTFEHLSAQIGPHCKKNNIAISKL